MASTSKTHIDKRLTTPVIGDKAHQPRSFKFPKRGFGKTSVVRRSFQPQWFDRWQWLHYSEEKDLAFCYTCIVAFENNHLVHDRCLEITFISTGFSNWKDATLKFNKHEGSRCHKDALLKTTTIPSTTKDVGEMLSSGLAKEREQRRKAFLKLLSNARFLCRQGLAFRGDGDDDSNFLRLIHLRSEDNPSLTEWMKKKTNKYCSHEIQNEMIKVMALRVLRDVAASIQNAPFFTVMVDETTDASNIEQVVILLRWVNESFEVAEELVGLYQVASTEAEMIYGVITDVFKRLNLAVSKVRGQCYDGAATMSGKNSGVATRLQRDEPRAVFTHCYGHSLNLACGDTVKRCKLMRDALDTTHEITKLIKKSPARDAIFNRLKEEMASGTPGIRVLCPTRWTVRSEALKSVLDNFQVLLKLWEESVEKVKDTEMKARIQGVASQMIKFDFFFGVSLGLLILKHTDNLSRTMQGKDVSAAEGQKLMQMTVATLASIRNDASFDLFWQKTNSAAEDVDVEKPSLPRRRKMPRRLDDGSDPTFPDSAEKHYRTIYFEALDLIISCIEDRFNQAGYKIFRNVQDLLLKSAAGEHYDDELRSVLSFYGSDFDILLLPTQLEVFSTNFKADSKVTVGEIIRYFQKCSDSQKQLLSQVSKLVRLLLVMPATNAGSERCFSALRRTKTYLRSTMKQERLNHLMLLHVHKERTDDLDLVNVANDFLFGSEHRMNTFGAKFMTSDLS